MKEKRILFDPWDKTSISATDFLHFMYPFETKVKPEDKPSPFIEALNKYHDKEYAPKSGSPVVHPDHYNAHPSGVECIDVAQWFGFNLGNAIKYIWRCDHKGKKKEDINKAIEYLNLELKRMEKTEKEAKLV
jgi:hypothetical protein